MYKSTNRELTEQERLILREKVAQEIVEIYNGIVQDAIKRVADHYMLSGINERALYMAIHMDFNAHGRLTRHVDRPIEWGDTGHYNDVMFEIKQRENPAPNSITVKEAYEGKLWEGGTLICQRANGEQPVQNIVKRGPYGGYTVFTADWAVSSGDTDLLVVKED